MSISAVRPAGGLVPHDSISTFVGASSSAMRHPEVVDTLIRAPSDPWTDTPITDSLVESISAPARPVSEKVTLALLTPILVPITAALDVLLWPFVKMGQIGNWVKSQFS